MLSGVTHVPLGKLLPSRFSSVKRRAAGLIRGLRSILKQLKPSGNEVYREVRQVNMNDEGGDALAGREQKPHCPRGSPSHGLSPRFSAAPREVLGGLVRQINPRLATTVHGPGVTGGNSSLRRKTTLTSLSLLE